MTDRDPLEWLIGIIGMRTAVAIKGSARFQRMARLGSECPQHHNLHHEIGPRRRWLDHDAVHWAVDRLE
jgi:hypothetical protein